MHISHAKRISTVSFRKAVLGAILCFQAGGLVCRAAEDKTSYTLVKNAQPRATIILSSRPTLSAQLGALELRHHMKLITGAELPMVNEPGTFDGLKLYVGESEAAKKSGIANDGFKSQEYTVKFLPGAIVLAGRDKPDFTLAAYDPENLLAAKLPSPWDEIGTLYAVYDFLRDCCGVRWINPTEVGTVHPVSRDLVVTGKDVRRQPFMSFRAMTSVNETNYGRYDKMNQLWLEKSSSFKEWDAAAYPALHAKYPDQNNFKSAKERILQLFLLRARYGGEWLQGCHSLYGYYNRFWEKDPKCPEAFETKHRDWFAKGYDPSARPDQMCFTNPGLVEQVVKDARDYFEGRGRHPFSGKPTPGEYFWGKDYFSVTPMDNTSYCKCPDCRKLLQEGSEQGYATPLHFTFINQVAKGLKQTHPDKWIYCNAYAANLEPPDFPLEENVAVRFCLTVNRCPAFVKLYKEQLEMLGEWHAKFKGRKNQLFLVLFSCFPLESAQNGNWHCFPGFFAHSVGEQFKLFRDYKIKGVNHCGYGQDVESYVTFRLMDNPGLDVDTLLDDYFGMFGAAGKPLKAMYLLIEAAYADPANYPAGYGGGQTAEVAWTQLGTVERMEEMSQLMAEAEKLTDTPLHKNRVELWRKSIWDYMDSGRKSYVARMEIPIPVLMVPKVNKVSGNLDKVDWGHAAVISGWHRKGSGAPATRNLSGKIAHDSQYLYLELTDPCDTNKLVTSPRVFCYDCWEVFVAKRRSDAYRHYAVSPSGNMVFLSNQEINFRRNVQMEGLGITATSEVKPDHWVARLAMPLDRVLPGGLKDGDKFYLNVTRAANPTFKMPDDKGATNSNSWVSHTIVHTTDRLAELTLEE